MTPTSCETCDHVHPATRKDHVHRWMCMKFPRIAGFDPVAPTQGVNLEPYNKCRNVNVGHCPLWARRREGGQLEFGAVK